MPKYTVIIYTPQELNHSSFIQTGLFELEKMGFVEVKVKLDIHKNLGRYIVSDDKHCNETKQAYPKVSLYKLIDNTTQKNILFATDLYDFANQFSKAALEKCDVVFKRNYETEFVEKLPTIHQKKLRKLGLSFGVHSNHKRYDKLFFIGLMLSNFNVNYKWDRFLIKRINNTYIKQRSHWNFISTTRKISRFESLNKGTDNTILFQTRCFLREDQQDVINIHEQRHHIIKLLRKHFSNQFLGGFIPSKIANEKYADALSNVPSEPELYLDALKKAKIVIYTRGLANSPAWKMAEYCSQGKIIIAERLTTELPVPLEHGKELLFFDTDEELVENIKLVLTDESLGNDLSVNARRYFEKHIHPAQSVKRILDIMITKLDN